MVVIKSHQLITIRVGFSYKETDEHASSVTAAYINCLVVIVQLA